MFTPFVEYSTDHFPLRIYEIVCFRQCSIHYLFKWFKYLVPKQCLHLGFLLGFNRIRLNFQDWPSARPPPPSSLPNNVFFLKIVASRHRRTTYFFKTNSLLSNVFFLKMASRRHPPPSSLPDCPQQCF